MYRKVVVYIDENGKELSALDVHKRNKGNSAIQKSRTDGPSTAVPVATDEHCAKNICSPRTAPQNRKSLDNGQAAEDADTTEDHSCSSHLSKAEGKGVSMPSSETPGVRSVVINKVQCSDLLARTVSRTNGHSVDSLLRLHHQMSLCVYQHRHNYDKSALLKDLELCLHRHTEQRPNSSHRPVSL
jgi:hypothetical protein